MKEIELKALNELTEIYEKYFYEGITENIQKQAKEAYDQYRPANTLLDNMVNTAVGKLFAIGYPDVNSGIEAPSKEEAKNILAELEKLRNKIE